MNRAQKILLLLVFTALAGLPLPAYSQTPPSDEETWNKYKLRLLREMHPVSQTDAPALVMDRTKAAVAAKPTTVTAPEGFAGRINDSFADFLPLFQFAVDTLSTSDDQKSVTVKFNPLKFDFGAFALTATVAEPQVFSEIETAITESARQSQSEALLKSTDDFGDITAAASFGYRRKAGNWSTAKRLYGREATLYRSLIEDLLSAAFNAVPASVEERRNQADQTLAQLAGLLQSVTGKSPDEITFKEIRDLSQIDETAPRPQTNEMRKLPSNFESRLVAALFDFVKAQDDFNNVVGSFNFDALPTLIDNQPQIVLSASRRLSADVVGPDVTTYTFSYEMGSNNFNEVLSRYNEMRRERSDAAPPLDPRGLSGLKLSALKDVVDEKGLARSSVSSSAPRTRMSPSTPFITTTHSPEPTGRKLPKLST